MLNLFIRQTMGYDVHCGPVDEIARCPLPLFENATQRMEAQKPLNSNHDPPLRYHRWKSMRLDLGETNTVLNFRISRQGAEWWERTECCNSHDYLPFCNAIVLEGELEEFTNFYSLLQLHSPLDGDKSTQIDKSSAPDCAKVVHFDWDRHGYEIFHTSIAA